MMSYEKENCTSDKRTVLNDWLKQSTILFIAKAKGTIKKKKN
jgi:hypothetical protein